jgi:hypothetical protein
MATSGTSAFNVTRNEICQDAARKIGAMRAGATMSSAMLTDFARALNSMVKAWSADGLHVWTVAEGVLFPQSSQVSYSAGAGATDHITQSYVATALASAAASGATSLSVDSIAGISDANYVGVMLDSGSLQWTTANGVPAGSTIALDDALTDAAAAGNAVFAYTSKIVRPLRVTAARRYNVANGQDTALADPVSRLEYDAIPNKAQTGIVNLIFYDPQLTLGVFKLWQPPSTVTDLIKFVWWRPIEDFNAAGDNPDLPQEWIRTLTWNLALEMAPEFDVPVQKYMQVQAMAASTLEQVSGFGREAESIQFGVDFNS